MHGCLLERPTERKEVTWIMKCSLSVCLCWQTLLVHLRPEWNQETRVFARQCGIRFLLWMTYHYTLFFCYLFLIQVF